MCSWFSLRLCICSYSLSVILNRGVFRRGRSHYLFPSTESRSPLYWKIKWFLINKREALRFLLNLDLSLELLNLQIFIFNSLFLLLNILAQMFHCCFFFNSRLLFSLELWLQVLQSTLINHFLHFLTLALFLWLPLRQMSHPCCLWILPSNNQTSEKH